ncbi:hypothetical protein [Burkholderia sp. MSMB1072]|uniref:hypothetical protein n=1 Tax=Burkholderia sp. MSMB1072 TaxID=1637871 RepID=UPI0012E33B1A|nr:hypothetical protein [Burkholderia sp. MSMB1072]
MSTGIAIYGIDPTQAVSTLEAAEDLFRQLGSEATRAIFFKFVVRGGERTVDDQETSLPDLRSTISNGEVSAFQVFNEVGVPTISFGCNVPEFFEKNSG